MIEIANYNFDKLNIIQFLKAKIKESLDKPQFINYTESKAYKVARELEKKFPPQELEQIRQEVKGEIIFHKFNYKFLQKGAKYDSFKRLHTI